MKESQLNDEQICLLIIESIDDTIAAEDRMRLDAWRNADPAHEELFQSYVNVQVNLEHINNKHRYDTQSSWEALDKKLVIKKTDVFQWYRLAAAVLIILSLGYYFLEDKYVVINTMNNTSTSITLPDGTMVKMNRFTTIKYNKDGFLTNKKLELIKGEIYVHVIKHDGPQFTVHIGKVDARDIGTSFNISRGDKEVSITVADGSVALRDLKSNREIILNKGQVGFYTVKTEKLKAANNHNVNYKAWVDKNFVFDEMPFKEVALQLEEVYQTKITITGDKLRNRKLTAHLQYQNIDSAMAVISASLQCKFAKYKDTYVLSDQ
jgi:transmembrane sensor